MLALLEALLVLLALVLFMLTLGPLTPGPLALLDAGSLGPGPSVRSSSRWWSRRNPEGPTMRTRHALPCANHHGAPANTPSTTEHACVHGGVPSSDVSAASFG